MSLLRRRGIGEKPIRTRLKRAGERKVRCRVEPGDNRSRVIEEVGLVEALTERDIDMLQEALDALLEKGTFSDFVGDLFTGILCRTSEERAKLERERQEAKRQREEEKRLLKERVTLLKAKLIMLKDRMAVEQITKAD